MNQILLNIVKRCSYLIVCGLLLLPYGCREPDGRGTTYISRPYYERLIDADKFYASQRTLGEEKQNRISISFRGRKYSADNPQYFEQYWVPAGDTHWYGKRNTSLGPGPEAVMNRFTSVSITCDKDYDEFHPEGSDLGDIVMYGFESGGLFVDSGYEDESGLLTEELLKDLTPESLRLIGSSMSSIMYFAAPPAEHEEFTFTITFHQDAGDLSATVNFVYQ